MTEERPAASPHDDEHDEPLGPATPDAETPLGDTPEAHDEISPHDLPPDHPGRHAAEEQARDQGGVTRGDVGDDG
jgi:hypothetical protein